MPRFTTALFAMALLAPQMVLAATPNIRFGKLELHPFASLKEDLDSNIYLVPPDEPNGVRTGGGVRSSWITRVGGGFNFKFPVTDMHKLSGGYNVLGNLYSTQPKLNNSAHQEVNARYDYMGPMGISGKAWDKYINTEDPAFSEVTDRETRWQNTAGVGAEYAPGGNFYTSLDLQQTTHKYLSVALSPTLNRYEQLGTWKVGYKVQPKTKAYVGYGRQIVHYTANISNVKNNKSHLINVGVEGQLLQKLTGMVETGVSLRDYDDSNGSVTGYSQNWIVATQLGWKPRERCDFSLRLSRSIQESTFNVNRFYVSNAANLSASHKFPHKVTMRVGLGVTIDRYPETVSLGGVTANRRDDIYTQSVGFDYAVQPWLAAGLDYTHREKNSVFTGQFNYEQHLTSLGVKATF